MHCRRGITMNQSVLSVNAATSFITPNLWHSSRMGKTTVPVKPMQSVYAHFKHIIGVPSRDEGATVPFTKLRYLDNLIERLVQIQSRESGAYQKVGYREIGDVDGFVQKLQSELRTKVIAEIPSFGGFFSVGGNLINLLA